MINTPDFEPAPSNFNSIPAFSMEMLSLSEKVNNSPWAEKINDTTYSVYSPVSPSEAARDFDKAMKDAGINDEGFQTNDYWFKSLSDMAMDGQVVSASLGSENIQGDNVNLTRTARLLSVDHSGDLTFSDKAIFKKELVIIFNQTGSSNGIEIDKSLEYGLAINEDGNKHKIRIRMQERDHNSYTTRNTKLVPDQFSAITKALKYIFGAALQ